MSISLYSVVETALLGALVGGSLLYLVARICAAPLGRLRLILALRLGRPGQAGWKRRLAARLAPPPADSQRGCGSGGCPSCRNCG